MRKLLRLIPIRQLIRNNLLNPPPILPIEYIIITIPMTIHIMRPNVPPDLSILIQSLQLLALGVAIVLQSDGVVG